MIKFALFKGRSMRGFSIQALLAGCCLVVSPEISRVTAAEGAYSRWSAGPSNAADFFPIAVWLQSPHRAEQYKQAGINVYVGLWKGPTAEQLSALKAAGMKVVCDQNDLALNSPDRDIIIAWMHGDEPDNAQPLPNKAGYGPPISPEKIVNDYAQLQKRDSSRPILLNLGQGVAYDDYIGRGVRRNHPEDYPQYIRGADIVSFDIYPAVHDKPEVAGKLEYVAKGVKRLREWSNDSQVVWNCIEASRISNVAVKPTPAQIKTEVWMSIIHGSRGIIYFVHQFEPSFREASLLDDLELLSAVTAINHRIQQLSSVINSPSTTDAVKIAPTTSLAEIAYVNKTNEGQVFTLSVNMQAQACEATIQVAGDNEWSSTSSWRDLETEEEFGVSDGSATIPYGPYQVRLLVANPSQRN
jgi:hypothetical protein